MSQDRETKIAQIIMFFMMIIVILTATITCLLNEDFQIRAQEILSKTSLDSVIEDAFDDIILEQFPIESLFK